MSGFTIEARATATSEVIDHGWRLKIKKNVLRKWGWYGAHVDDRAQFCPERSPNGEAWVDLVKYDAPGGQELPNGVTNVVPQKDSDYCILQPSRRVVGKFNRMRAHDTRLELLNDGRVIRVHFPKYLTQYGSSKSLIDTLLDARTEKIAEDTQERLNLMREILDAIEAFPAIKLQIIAYLVGRDWHDAEKALIELRLGLISVR